MYRFNQRQKSHRTAIILAWALVVVGLGGLIYSLVSARFNYFPGLAALRPPGTSQSTLRQSVKPDSDTIANYHVAPNLPKYISIPSIGVVKARIIQLGLKSNKQIASPSNIYDVGWFKQSAEPGQSGQRDAMFLFGHVSSWTAGGVFFKLKNLRPGNEIKIVRGDNKEFTYYVKRLKIYPHDKVDMQAVLSPVDKQFPGLNLMTCTGSVIQGTSEFSERLVVFASSVN